MAYAGIDTVTVEFVSGHLRNDLRTEDSFLYLEKLNETPKNLEKDQSWETVAVDGDWETQIEWIRTNVITGESKVQIRWSIPLETESGTYRIRHAGKYKVIRNHLIQLNSWTQYSMSQTISNRHVFVPSKNQRNTAECHRNFILFLIVYS